jgi:hypothetical protein
MGYLDKEFRVEKLSFSACDGVVELSEDVEALEIGCVVERSGFNWTTKSPNVSNSNIVDRLSRLDLRHINSRGCTVSVDEVLAHRKYSG